MIDVKALFLGPKAENQNLYESLIVEIVRDSCFLRKNFHPQDDTIISEKDKLKKNYYDTIALLKQHLQGVLSELKKGVPLYHPRYIGHMHGDLLISGIAAYFATMLYNPNNVVGESSPATTKMELEYINALCKMVGYKSCEKLTGDYSWGHLCAGGTTANIEALWVARNIKYYPLSAKLAAKLVPECKFIGDIFINELGSDIKSVGFNELFNLSVSEILNLKDEIYNRFSNRKPNELVEVKNLIDKFSVTRLGVYGIHHMIEKLEVNKEHIELPKVYIAKSYHYSWEKALDVIGIGQDQLVKVDIDSSFRMDIEDLCNKLNESGTSTLAVIGILGSSKQGSIDPIDEIVEFRSKKELEKYSFIIHVDGAYGGYFPSVFMETIKSESFASDKEVLGYLKRENSLFKLNGKSTINEKWCKKIRAISKADSITIDPHKMGYIPYPAGSVLFADTRMKDFISYHPTYLNTPSDETDLCTAFLGQWTLEGSRPGAAAAACFLSNKVLPFTQEAHGLLIKNSMHAADIFWNTIETFNADEEINQGFKVIPLYAPETNIVSYVVSFPDAIKKSCYLNQLNVLLYKHFSIKGDTIIPGQNFMVAKESFDYCDINSTSFLSSCGIDSKQKENQIEITMLSSVFMNPLSVYLDSNFYMDFWKEVVKTGKDIMTDIILDILSKKYHGERLRVLWVEDDRDVQSLRKQILVDSSVGKCLDITFVNSVTTAQKKMIYSENNSEESQAITQLKKWEAYIFDLNLKSNHPLDAKEFTPQDLEDIMPTKGLIELISLDERENVLVYSSYLNNARIKNEHIIPELKTLFKDQSKFEEHLISKTGNYIKDKQKIVNGIFSITQAW